MVDCSLARTFKPDTASRRSTRERVRALIFFFSVFICIHKIVYPRLAKKKQNDVFSLVHPSAEHSIFSEAHSIE